MGRFTAADGTITHVTDIIGEEDFFGEMDFKVSGTRDGITGIQLDLKARGLWFDEIETIFAQAKEGRLELIEAMEGAIPAPREELSQYAPRLITVRIDPDKIGKLIDLVVRPSAPSKNALVQRSTWMMTAPLSSLRPTAKLVKLCQAEVEALCAEVKVGSIYEGKVVSVKDFGCFVEIAQGTDGMCHISELDNGYVEKVENVVKVGDKIKVKVINVDDSGRIKLSRKALLKDEEKAEEAETTDA